MTPQHSFAMQHSPPPNMQHALPQSYSQSFSMPYDGSQHAHPQSHLQAPQQPQYSQSFPNGPVSNPAYAQSFGDNYGNGSSFTGKPQIYTVRPC